MPIIDKEGWKRCVENNKDPYGKCCVDVARKVMKTLDLGVENFNCHELICAADKEIDAGGITGFMAGCVASMVSKVHSRGEEFRKKWNLDNQIGTEGEDANKGNGVLNPALLNIGKKAK